MKRWLIHLNDFVMGGLAIAAIVLAFQPDEGWVRDASIAIWLVFLFEYSVRLAFAKARWRFLRENIPDLIAILPYDYAARLHWDSLNGMHLDALRGARALRILRLLRFLRLVRGFSILWRINGVVQGVFRTNHLREVVLVASATIVAAGLGICLVPNETIREFGDGLWWSLTTAATVGYGEYAPVTTIGRLIAAALMLMGIGTLGMITGSIATYFLGQRGLANPHVRHIQKQLDGWEAMDRKERADVVRLLAVLAAEPDGSTSPELLCRARPEEFGAMQGHPGRGA